MVIKANKINSENFVKYGRIVLNPTGEPTSQASDYKFWPNIANYKIEGPTEIGICTVFKQDKNIIKGMEHHKLTPEILIPIDAPFVLPLLHPEESPDKAEAFLVDIGEAVIIDQNIWHGACLPVGRDQSSYFVIFRKDTPQEDVYKKEVYEFLIQF
ncbi:MAG: ureidoglycolate lyase [Ignavibacteriae bacterium]|nr:ureidoglycolate lyase [Ignavibacteriota bacterium]